MRTISGNFPYILLKRNMTVAKINCCNFPNILLGTLLSLLNV